MDHAARQFEGDLAFPPRPCSPPAYVFPHVPKCAGTTVKAHMAALLGDRSVAVEHDRRLGVARRDPALLEDVRDGVFFSGHFLPEAVLQHLEGREVREAVLLRDPVSYCWSFYTYIRRVSKKPRRAAMSFPFWYACQPPNPVASFLLGRYFGLSALKIGSMDEKAQFTFLVERLNRFWFVGSHQHCAVLLERMCEELGVSRPVESLNTGRGETMELDAAMQARIRKENRVDQALFDLFCDRRWDGRRLSPAWPEASSYPLHGRWLRVAGARLARHVLC